MSGAKTNFNRVREFRNARGWSQAELARRGSVSRAAVSALETQRLIPSVSAALKLAACFDCTVEDLFGRAAQPKTNEWAWPPTGDVSRYWRAEVAGRCLSFPVEETVAGELAHDGIRQADSDQYQPLADPAQTLVVAGCDPAAGLLVSQYAAQTGLRMIVLGRSSGCALELLKQGLVHVAGIHLSLAGAGHHGGNAGALPGVDLAGGDLGAVGLLRLACWEEGVTLSPGHSSTSLRSALRERVQWIGREPGSGARQCLDELLGGRTPRRIARDHRGVANAVRSGWADAGVCIRLVSEEAGLRFFPVRDENYDLIFSKAMQADPRIQALVRVVRSSTYRRLLGELPGYGAAETGDLEWFGPKQKAARSSAQD